MSTIRYSSIIIAIFTLPLFTLCKNNQTTIPCSDRIDLALLDSTSINTELPYGREEVIVFDFPEHWYCGGGFLEASLKEEGLDDTDSIKYAQAYFAIIESQRIDYSLGLHEISFGDSTIKQIEHNFGKPDDLISYISSIKNCYSYIKLPDCNGYHVYGVVVQTTGYTELNPLYIVVNNNGEIVDGLITYEYAPPHSITNKSCYIDESYIFHVKHFYNIDGFEVSSHQLYKRYRISEKGRFELCN